MRNIVVRVKDNRLFLEIDLTAEGVPSTSGRAVTIASTGGNLRLTDENGYRPELLNLNVFRPRGDT